MIQKKDNKKIRTGFVFCKSERIVFSQNDFLFTFIRTISLFDNEKYEMQFEIKKDFIYGIDSTNHQIAIYAKNYNKKFFSKKTIYSPLYIVSDYNIDNTPIDSYKSITISGQAINEICSYEMFKKNKKELNDFYIETIDLDPDTKLILKLNYLFDKDCIKKNCSLTFEFNSMHTLDELCIFYQKIQKFLSLFLFYKNPSFDSIKIGIDGSHSATVHFLDDDFPRQYNRKSIKINKNIDFAIKWYNLILKDEQSNKPLYSLKHIFDSNRRYIVPNDIKDVCTALEIEINNNKNIIKFEESNERITSLQNEVSNVINNFFENYKFLESEKSNITSSIKYWTMGIKDKIKILGDYYSNHLKKFCSSKKIDLFINDKLNVKCVNEFVEYRNKNTHSGKYLLNQELIDTTLAMRALVHISLLHRLSMNDEKIDEYVCSQVHLF